MVAKRDIWIFGDRLNDCHAEVVPVLRTPRESVNHLTAIRSLRTRTTGSAFRPQLSE
jgi:hypothetical protein